MSDPHNSHSPPGDSAADPYATGPKRSVDLSRIPANASQEDGQAAGDGTGIRTVADTMNRWEAPTEQAAPVAGAVKFMERAADAWMAETVGIARQPDVSGRLINGRYRLIAELALGGMGVTYRAWDAQAGIPVVVKMPRREVRSDSEAMRRFAREIDSLRAVPHEHIVPITDHGDDEGCPFVVMRFLPGGSLADYRRWDEAGNPIRNPPGMLHFWLPGVAAALDHIHAKGMLHRDVKPGNIFLDGFLQPYLGDFGIAKVVDDSGGLAKEQTLTATKMAVGTPEYMAPELLKPRSQPDGRVDQYALAVTVYEMIAGEKPFKGDRAHIIVEHSGLPVPPLAGHVPGLPTRLCDAVEKALAKTPADRFPTCSAFAAAVLAEVAVLPPEPDTVRLLCPGCKNILKLPQKAAGKTGKCPRCREALDVAADLGSLWLKAEERGGGLAVESQPVDVRGEMEEELPRETLPRRRWGGKEWAAVALAACCGLAAGYPWARVTSDRAFLEAEGAWRRQLQDMVEKHQALIAKNDRLEGEFQKLVESQDTLTAANRKLTQELKALRAAATVRPSVPAPATPDQSPAEAVVQPRGETLTNSIGITFRLIPAGSFTMGDENGDVEERPAHQVTITRPFYLGVHEVTNAQYRHVIEDVPSTWKDDDRPVETVSWEQARAFCRKLSELPEERRTGRVYRLPTEAEWEYACRAGTTTSYSFGDSESQLGEFAWFGDNSGGQTHPVGRKKPNAWGLYDMHGNVWEWVGDWYDSGYYARSSGADPQGPPGGSGRVYRGGSWSGASNCRSAIRYRHDPSRRFAYLGFRIALSVSESGEPEAVR